MYDGDSAFSNQGKEAIAELRLLLHYCALHNIDSYVVVDPSLVPRFSYYTGMIFIVRIENYGGKSQFKTFQWSIIFFRMLSTINFVSFKLEKVIVLLLLLPGVVVMMPSSVCFQVKSSVYLLSASHSMSMN